MIDGGDSIEIDVTVRYGDENAPALARYLAQDASDGVGLTWTPSDERETRLRALFTLFFHEAGLEPAEATIVALAAATRRMGYLLVPVRR